VLLQVFNDVELDATVAQDFQRATTLASARIVVHQQFVHWHSPKHLNWRAKDVYTRGTLCSSRVGAIATLVY